MARIRQGATGDAHNGRPTEGQRPVNPPIEAGSTILFTDCRTFMDRKASYAYGTDGSPTHWAFEENLARLENADSVVLTPSGLTAITLPLLALAKKGGHVLITDSAYGPTRQFCDGVLSNLGIETTYFDPLCGADIAAHIRPETCAILCESPGSLTFEIQDLPAIIKAAGDVPVLVDNTWGAGVYLKPLEMGAAISIHALTKYVSGHSDLLMGAVMCRDSGISAKVHSASQLLGNIVPAADVSLAHRGLRTMHRRLEVHEQSAYAVARWFEARDEIAAVLHPGLPSHPQHEIWRRDFTGACGLFSIIADWSDRERTIAFVDALELFGVGYSWGGFESLCTPASPTRTARAWTEERQLMRFHIGLEDVDDLIADLDQAFAASR